MPPEVKVSVKRRSSEFPVDFEEGFGVASCLLGNEDLDGGTKKDGVDDDLEDIR